MTLREAYLWGKQELQTADVIDFEQDAWLLLEYVTGYNRSYYFCHDMEQVLHEKEIQYRQLVAERGKRIPLQQLTGTQEFMGIEFFVNEHVLIPRQDTEILIEEAEKRILGEMQILDMCTGSGCILLSLLKRNKSLNGMGIDISTEALKVAKTNAKRLLLNPDFKKSDLFEEVEGSFDMILSNPPYIKSKEIEELEPEVRDFEPRLALDGLEDGLFFYRKLAKESGSYLKEKGWLLLEIGMDQGIEVKDLLKIEGFTEIEVVKDLAGYDRVVCARKA